MKHLKLYEEYTSKPNHPGFFETYEETKNWLDQMGLKNYTINDDLVVDVDGDINLAGSYLKHIPVQFGKVDGNFNCSFNQLTSLIGAPSKVSGGFYCYNNQLTSLTGRPSSVKWDYYCSDNYLTSLTGCPSYVGEDFDCSSNQLTSLTGSPSEVGGNFDCSDNKLTSLTGAPSSVGETFYCSDNYLTSLKGAPRKHDNFFYNYNNYLTIEISFFIRDGNPGYYETSISRITQNFIDKLETSGLDSTTQLRILKSLETSKPKVYSELGKLVDLDNWLSRLQNSETHIDILNL